MCLTAHSSYRWNCFGVKCLCRIAVDITVPDDGSVLGACLTIYHVPVVTICNMCSEHMESIFGVHP